MSQPCGTEHSIDTNPARSMRRRYIAGLLVVAVLSVSMFAALEVLVLRSEKWGTVINVAGRQRMLSQKIAKAAERHDNGQLASALATFERSHRALIDGDPALHLPPTVEPQILEAFEEMTPAYEGLVRAARAIAELPEDEPVPAELSRAIARYEADFLPQMHNIVGMYEGRSRTENGTLVLVHLFVVLLTLLVLLLEAIWVFEPAARRLREQWARVRASQERFSLAIKGSQDAIWDWDLLQNQLYFSPRWAALFRDDRLLGSVDADAWFRLVASCDIERLHEHLDLLRSGRVDQIDLEIEMRTPQGEAVYVLCRGASVRDEHGRIARIAGSLADITEQREAREQLRDMAERDSLTGLGNRSFFYLHLEVIVGRAQRTQKHDYALLSLDFDGFKSVNDALGHSVGDQLLISIAKRLQKHTAENATIARLGGDEFAIILRDGDADSVMALSDALVQACAKPHTLGQHQIVSTASIGVVVGDDRYTNAEDVVRDADSAMYNAKISGKSQARLFDESMHSEALRRLKLEHYLREANFDRDFEIKLQPIVSLESGAPTGFEVLVRWVSPGLEDVGPDTFIPIAEEIGVMADLGQWILIKSTETLASFDEALGHQRTVLHVNVSKRQILHPQLMPLLIELVDRYPEQRGRLILEITETAVMDRRANLVPRMEAIREIGFPLAMDDFGTGHSSLACLHKFPLDEVKIDRSFILNIEDSREFTAIYHAIVSLADHLGLKVVAEGVETEAQLVQLQAMGCAFGQGYLFDRPLSPDDALAFMRRGGIARPAA